MSSGSDWGSGSAQGARGTAPTTAVERAISERTARKPAASPCEAHHMVFREPRVREDASNHVGMRVEKETFDGVAIGLAREALALSEGERPPRAVVGNTRLVVVHDVARGYVGAVRARARRRRSSHAETAPRGLFAQHLDGAPRTAPGSSPNTTARAAPPAREGRTLRRARDSSSRASARRPGSYREEDVLGGRLPKLGVGERKQRTDELLPTHFGLKCSRSKEGLAAWRRKPNPWRVDAAQTRARTRIPIFSSAHPRPPFRRVRRAAPARAATA